MSQSQAVVRTAGADKPTLDYDPQDRHMTVLKNGPGMHLNIAFSAGGVYAEAACRKGAIILGLGPYAASEAIVQLFGDDAKRLEILNELFRLRGHPAAEQIDGIDGTAKLQAPAKPSKAVQKLKKLCGRVLKYTHERELEDTQLLAYKCIVMLTTRYIGLRWLFIENIFPRDPSAIARSWREGSAGGDQEWSFFLDYAAYCIAAPDQITQVVEALNPSRFGCFEGSLCVSEHLANWISNTLAATELSRLVAVGYLAGILELHSFWERRIKEDLHSLSDVLCLIELRLLEDLATDCETRHLEKIQDLVTMDPEGINSDRSKALFPDASKRAERFLPKPKPKDNADIHDQQPLLQSVDGEFSALDELDLYHRSGITVDSVYYHHSPQGISCAVLLNMGFARVGERSTTATWSVTAENWVSDADKDKPTEDITISSSYPTKTEWFEVDEKAENEESSFMPSVSLNAAGNGVELLGGMGKPKRSHHNSPYKIKLDHHMEIHENLLAVLKWRYEDEVGLFDLPGLRFLVVVEKSTDDFDPVWFPFLLNSDWRLRADIHGSDMSAKLKRFFAKEPKHYEKRFQMKGNFHPHLARDILKDAVENPERPSHVGLRVAAKAWAESSQNSQGKG
ncbi:hypothetical protein FIBSPDRAFT_1038393, partial [Athelia psychrophila]